jgi:hypothetical protein
MRVTGAAFRPAGGHAANGDILPAGTPRTKA